MPSVESFELDHNAVKAPQITSAARDIDWILEKAGIEKANILGYSMGGRLALTFALTYPNKVGKLILESASPGLEEEDQRAASKY